MDTKDMSFLQTEATVKNTKKQTSKKGATMKIDVQNDNAVIDIADLTLNIKSRVTAIQTKAQSWWKKSQEDLYDFLHQCLLLLVDIQAIDSKAQSKTVMESMDKILKGIELESTPTKLPNKIVACVFGFKGMDRKHISKYASVLNKFVELHSTKDVEDNFVFNKDKADNFVSWLTEGGGINGVLISKTKTTESNLTIEQKLPIAERTVSETEAINTIDNAYGVETDKAFVLYVVPNAEGKLEVKKVVTNDKFIKPITTSFYDEQSAETVDADAVEEEARQSVKAS